MSVPVMLSTAVVSCFRFIFFGAGVASTSAPSLLSGW